MTESYLFSFTYALQTLYWLIVYGLAGLAVKHALEDRLGQRQSSTQTSPRVKPKRRG